MKPNEPFLLMDNPVQDYAWGSAQAIPELLGKPNPACQPRAELWMGTHPKAPSRVLVGGDWLSLPDLVAEDPEHILGPAVTARFDGGLPFLFKVLAAARPLSIQAHPNLDQAREGFARENKMGIPVGAPHRNYRDANHKPETICALTPFHALRGFRKLNEILALMVRAGVPALAAELGALRAGPGREGLRRFFSTLMSMDKAGQAKIVEQAVDGASSNQGDPAFDWMVRLDKECPGDIGVLSPILLNVIVLQPGQAMFLPAGELHAYLDGVGIELMANSDNVLRGGLTPKHMDVPELLRVLTFSEGDVEILEREPPGPTERAYPQRAEEFVLSVVSPGPGNPHKAASPRNVEIMICIEGQAAIGEEHGDDTLELVKGASVLIPAATGPYRVEGRATLYKATVPGASADG